MPCSPALPPSSRAALAAFTAMLALAMPTAASASGVEITAADDLVVEAAPGEDNDVNLFEDGGDLVVVDKEGISAGAGCAQVSALRATCPLAAFDFAYVFVADGENRVYAAQDHPIYIDGFQAAANNFQTLGDGETAMIGGNGPDVFSSGWSDDHHYGHGGADEFTAGSGDDELHGGDGDDVMNPGSGDDDIHGEADVDSVDYAARVTPVEISIDNVKNDGSPGELDNVRVDVERVYTGTGADEITGSGDRDLLHGGGGADSITGNGGNDDLFGEAGGDDVHGGTGIDLVNGGGGNDDVDGSFEGDLLYGGDGNDEIDGGTGGDQIFANDGNDHVEGGVGDDEIKGGNHDDSFAGHQGRDEFSGGAGSDTVDYAAYGSAVTVDLDGSADDDGAANEGDTVDADVENVRGGSGPDAITGNDVVNRLDGGAGNDTLDGRAAADEIVCGPGLDKFVPDPADTLSACDLPPQPPVGGGQQGGQPGGQPEGGTNAARPKLSIGPRTVRVDRKRVARMAVRCPRTAKAACTGTLRLQRTVKGKVRKLGSRRFRVPVGAKRTVRIKLRRKDAKRVARRPLKVKAVGRARDAGSGAAGASRRVTLKRRASR